jgi:hypothetical protein
MWNLTYEMFSRVYTCTKVNGRDTSEDYHRCMKFLSEEAAAMYEWRMRPLEFQQIKMCYFTPALFDYRILKYKLKTLVLVLND